MATVSETVRYGLCSGCGICKGMCPKGCISWIKTNGLYVPWIDESDCINCGLCASVCPGLGHAYEAKENAEQTATGNVLECWNVWSKDAQIRHVSASGGVVSTLIRELVIRGCYDGAFCLDSYDYRSQLQTRLYTAEEIAQCWAASNAPKSRYLPVSHENAVVYMKSNRNARLILVGTSCAIRGLQAAVKKLGLNREQYLFIGLFCERIFNYHVLTYFQNTYAAGSEITGLHFKNKESGGWPGDMKLFPEEGEPFYVPLAERAKAKAYFMPERCLYCVDKLNVCADISLGDNYTGKDDSKLGSNSVIIRTELGQAAWNAVKSLLEIREIGIEDIQNAQYIKGRLDNLYFGDLKKEKEGFANDLNSGVPRERERAGLTAAWTAALKRLQSSQNYDTDPVKLEKQIRKDNKKPNIVLRILRRMLRIAKRMGQGSTGK